MAERLWKPEGVNILKGQVGAEWVEWGHMAAENIKECWRMLGKKFYIAAPEGALSMAMTLVHPLFNTNKLTKNCVRLNMCSKCG